MTKNPKDKGYVVRRAFFLILSSMIILNNLSRCLSARFACLKNKLIMNMLKNIDNTLRVLHKTLFLVHYILIIINPQFAM